MKLFKVIFIFLFSLLLGSNYAQWNDGTPVSSGNGLDATPSEFLNNGYAVKCDGGSDGEIRATVSSGTGPYYYDWEMETNGYWKVRDHYKWFLNHLLDKTCRDIPSNHLRY